MSEMHDEGSAASSEPDAGTDQVAEIKAERKKKEKKRRKSGRSMLGPILLIALGVVLTTTMDGGSRPLGLVVVGVGGLCFLLGMKRRKQEEETAGKE